MLLDPDRLELAPKAPELLALLEDDPRFKLELPASQIEILTGPTDSIDAAAGELMAARRLLADRADGLVLLAGAGVHPFSRGAGELNQLERHRRAIEEYGEVARRQLVCALQVHVAMGDSSQVLPVYNAARAYLPLLAALSANGPFYEGRDSGLASVRPKLSKLLPRQGVPPAIGSWEEFAHVLSWGASSGAFPSARSWWWELRLNPRFGTLEFRVPDSQSTVADAAALAAIVQALVVWLDQRHLQGETLPCPPSWKVEENAWSACRDGVEGTMADLEQGGCRSTRECLHELLDALESMGTSRNASGHLAHARGMVQANGAIVQRQIATQGGPRAVARWLAERFLEPWPG